MFWSVSFVGTSVAPWLRLQLPRSKTPQRRHGQFWRYPSSHLRRGPPPIRCSQLAEAETGEEERDTTAPNEDSNSTSNHFQQEHKVDLPKLDVEKGEDEDGELVKPVTASLFLPFTLRTPWSASASKHGTFGRVCPLWITVTITSSDPHFSLS